MFERSPLIASSDVNALQTGSINLSPQRDTQAEEGEDDVPVVTPRSFLKKKKFHNLFHPGE